MLHNTAVINALRAMRDYLTACHLMDAAVEAPIFFYRNPDGTACARQSTRSLLFEPKYKVLRLACVPGWATFTLRRFCPGGRTDMRASHVPETEYGSLRPRRTLCHAASCKTPRQCAVSPVAAFSICAGCAGEGVGAADSLSAPVVPRDTPLYGHGGVSVSRMRTGASLQLTPAAAVTGRAAMMVELPPAGARTSRGPCPLGCFNRSAG